MTDERWESLVRRLERLARESPRRYRWRVGLLAGLGYGYIVGVLALLLAAIAAGIYLVLSGPAAAIKLVVPLGLLVIVILRALWVRLPPPEGIQLPRSEATALFDEIDELSAELDAPTVDEVLLDGELNAGIVQIPRLGLFGPQRNYMVIGLPLLQALSPDQFRAVIAHELGHLSGHHGRFSAWIYRVRQTWFRLVATLEESEHWGVAVFRRFFRWYAPVFNAYSFALARAHEYEADRAAAEVTGARSAAGALVSLEVASRFLGRSFWPAIYERASHEPAPPQAAFAPLAKELAETVRRPEVDNWLEEALREVSGSADTHPSLAERLAALGFPPDRVTRDGLLGGRSESGNGTGANGAHSEPWTVIGPGAANGNGGSPGDRKFGELARSNGNGKAGAPPPVSAAQRFLAQAEEGLTRRLDEQWRRRVADEWEGHYGRSQDGRRLLQELETKAEAGDLSTDEIRTRAELTAEHRGPTVAVALFRQALAARPDDARAAFGLGRALLEQGADEGLRHLETAMDGDASYVLPACELAYGFLTERGDDEGAGRVRDRAAKRYEVLEHAAVERRRVTVRDQLEPHRLSPAQVEELREQISRRENVRAAYVARKQVKQLADELPLYVLAVARRQAWWKPATSRARDELVSSLASELRFPGECLVVSLEGENKPLKRRLAKVPAAEIYRRPS